MLGRRKDNFLILISMGFVGLLQAQTKSIATPLIPQVKEYRIYQPQSTNLNIAPLIKRGYFCRLEDQVYKNSKFPVLFRLGTKKYVDQLEHK